MNKAIVSGVAGRMGKMIVNALHAADGIEVGGGLEKGDNPFIGKDIGEIAGIGRLDIKVEDSLDKIIKSNDVLIEFTSPEASLNHLRQAASANLPMVIGTTGLNQEQTEELRALSKKIPCVFSPNMSIGVNALFKLLKEAAGILNEGYDIEIVEAHHRFKKDAPSGTAKKLAEIIAEALGQDINNTACYGRSGMIGERKKEEIGILAVRAGDIVGEHTVIFGGIGERIELTHRAHSRQTFAVGAVRAAKFIIGKPPGLYTMADVLGL